MHITVDVHHHFHGPVDRRLDEILTRVTAIQQKEETIMSKLDDLQAELAQANATTNEIADDVTDLLTKIAAGGLSAEEADQVKADIQALNARLRGVADQHTV